MAIQPNRKVMTENVQYQFQRDANDFVRKRRASADGWIWEAISSILSLVCLAAIIIILSVYNDKTVPHFSHGLTVSFSISLSRNLANSVAQRHSFRLSHRFQISCCCRCRICSRPTEMALVLSRQRSPIRPANI
jgi:hypothetical protein